MSNYPRFALLALLTVVGLVSSTSAIKCYLCSGTVDCADPFKKDGATTCDFASVCVKAKTGSTFTRSCSPSIGYIGCKSVGSVTTCACDKELCNSGQQLNYGPYIILILLLALLLFNFHTSSF